LTLNVAREPKLLGMGREPLLLCGHEVRVGRGVAGSGLSRVPCLS